MGDIAVGFATIWAVIGVGVLLADRKVLDAGAQQVLGKVSFRVGMPCLLFSLMSTARLSELFSTTLVASAIAIAVTGVAYVVVARVAWRRRPAHLVIGAFCSCYVNANNLGLPIATYVIHQPAAVLPILLIQLGVLQPAGLTVLDILRARREGTDARRLWVNLTLPLRNPMTVTTLAGLVVNAAGWQVPRLIAAPVELAGGLAVPTTLIAFGISLRLGARPRRGPTLNETIVVSVAKLVVMPLIGFSAATAMGLAPLAVLAVTVMAGLPTANNVFLFALMYDEATDLARDANFITTFGSILTIGAIAMLVGA